MLLFPLCRSRLSLFLPPCGIQQANEFSSFQESLLSPPPICPLGVLELWILATKSYLLYGSRGQTQVTRLRLSIAFPSTHFPGPFSPSFQTVSMELRQTARTGLPPETVLQLLDKKSTGCHCLLSHQKYKASWYLCHSDAYLLIVAWSVARRVVLTSEVPCVESLVPAG